MRFSIQGWWLASGVTAFALASSAQAISLAPGDFVMGTTGGGVWKVDRTTGSATPIATLPGQTWQVDVTVSTGGHLIASSDGSTPSSGAGAVVRVQPSDGSLTQIASGLARANDVEADASGRVFVATSRSALRIDAPNATPVVLDTDPAGDPDASYSADLAITPAGRILFATNNFELVPDTSCPGCPPVPTWSTRLVGLDPDSGAFVGPFAHRGRDPLYEEVLVESGANGDAFVLQGAFVGSVLLFRVPAAGGAATDLPLTQALIAGGFGSVLVYDMARDLDGTLLLLSQRLAAPGDYLVLRFDPSAGTATHVVDLPRYPFLPTSLAVVPIPEPGTALLVATGLLGLHLGAGRARRR